MNDGRNRGSNPDDLGGTVSGGGTGVARVRPPGCDPTIQLQDGSKLKEELCTAFKDALRPVMVVMSGIDVGKRLAIGGTVVFGRDPTADVVLGDTGVSWRHARLEDRGDAWAIVDLGSTNGMMVRGQPCREAVLGPGDTVVLGRTALRFELRDSLQQAYDEELQRLIDIDDLSGLLVRRKFDGDLATLVEQARARGTAVGFLAMDMDGIKHINDTHGHLFGAYVIGETGHVIGHVLAGRGIACRFGGDEFIAALPGLDTRLAAEVGLEIHHAVNTHPYFREGIPLRPGISVGVASFPADAQDPVTLFDRADKALYRAKQSGKNRVSL